MSKKRKKNNYSSNKQNTEELGLKEQVTEKHEESNVFMVRNVIEHGFGPDDIIAFNNAVDKVWKKDSSIIFDFTEVKNYTASFFNQTLCNYLVFLGEKKFNEFVSVKGLTNVGKSAYKNSFDNAIDFMKERMHFYLPLIMQKGKILDSKPVTTEVFKSIKDAQSCAKQQIMKIFEIWHQENQNLVLQGKDGQFRIVDVEKKEVILITFVTQLFIREIDTCIKYESAIGHNGLPAVSITAHTSYDEGVNNLFFSAPTEVYFFDSIYWIDD